MAYGTVNTDLITNSNGLSGNAIGPGFKNRIINGAMMIDQRNAGAAVTVNANDTFYPVDRVFGVGEATDGVFTLQRTTTVPAGFINSVKATVTTADASIGATQRYFVSQRIEGLNCSDLDWGTANAKTVTLSFWVRSSLTGTFGGALLNSDNSRSYPYTYTINAADTWEQKSVTITGDTSGTWLTTSGIGIKVQWALGAGSSVKGTAGSWSGTLYWSATGATDVIGTLNATWYITGVQLEVGLTATSFDYRPYGTELALCQRYAVNYKPGVTDAAIAIGSWRDTTQTFNIIYLPIEMRTTPTMTYSSVSDWGSSDSGFHGGTSIACTSITLDTTSSSKVLFVYTDSAGGGTQYRPNGLQSKSATAWMLFSAEL